MSESTVRQIKVMISSTRADLEQYREEASKIIKSVAAEKEKRVQLVEVSMEKETQSGNREFAVAVSKRWVEESDWVVVVVGWNYGTISDEPGAHGLSVTEWEYKHALGLRKQVFVFIAGAPGTANAYRVGECEKHDLKDFFFGQTLEQQEKLSKFRQELSVPHADMFANLQSFRERLEKTLKHNIDDLLPDIQPGTPLAELIVAVTPHIRQCVRKVMSITSCKQIHDHLHELRQHVIRPLREEVLSVWRQEGTLSAARRKLIRTCVNKASRQLGAIGEARKSIGPQHQGLRDSVDRVLQGPDLWNLESDTLECLPTIDQFTEVVDEFAYHAQIAFSEADRSMTREESELRECFSALRTGLQDERQKRNLSPSDQKRLNEELDVIDANRLCMKESLATHHCWQEAHDTLHHLDSLRESGVFEKELNRYGRGNSLTTLIHLVGTETQLTEAGQANDAAPEQKDVAVATQPRSLASSALAEELRHLKECLEAIRQGNGAATFDRMRRPFDDAFYRIDKRTLTEVDGAWRRAVTLEEWLGGLAAPRRNAIARP